MCVCAQIRTMKESSCVQRRNESRREGREESVGLSWRSSGRFKDRPEELWYEVVGHDGAVGIVCLYNVCAAAAELQTSR